MKPLFLLFFFVLLVPVSFAFNCEYFNDPLKDDCLALQEANESLIASLIYNSSGFPDHYFIKEYNNNIVVTSPPSDAVFNTEGVIKDAWIQILTLSPSVEYQDKLFVSENVETRTEYGYAISLPSDYYSSDEDDGEICKILYSLESNSSEYSLFVNNALASNDPICTVTIGENSTLKAELYIEAVTRIDQYRWDKYCCGWSGGTCKKYCFDCDHSSTNYKTDNLIIQDSINVTKYSSTDSPSFAIIDSYQGSYKGVLERNDLANTKLFFNNSFFEEQNFVFNAEFVNDPYYFLRLTAESEKSVSFGNLLRDNYTLYVKDVSDCSLEYSDFFTTQTTDCVYNLSSSEPEQFEIMGFSESWNLLLKLLVFFAVIGLVYLGIKKSWGKVLIPVAMFPVFANVVHADCGLTNLASCIPEKIYDFIINLLNAPLQPLLTLMRTLLETPPSIDLFQGIWFIILYCLSMFYGLLFIYSGFQFLLSGHNVIKREMAKEWLKNTVIMIVLVQASYYLYGLIVELGSIMTSAVLSLVNEQFFMLTADSIINIGLEFLFTTMYVITLLFTILFLVIRYLIVAFGVLFAPVGIFCYFIPPLKSYGKLILGVLGVAIFITFLDAIIILACSMLADLPLFENFKMLVMISCLSIIDILFIIMIKHVIAKSSLADSGEKIAQAVKYIAMLA